MALVCCLAISFPGWLAAQNLFGLLGGLELVVQQA